MTNTLKMCIFEQHSTLNSVCIAMEICALEGEEMIYFALKENAMISIRTKYVFPVRWYRLQTEQK